MNRILPFLPNRVLRLYRGGSGIDRLCGNPDPVDSDFPENWMASCIEGNGRRYHSPGHGISRILADGQEVLFPDYLKAHTAELLGEKHAAKYGPIPAVLVKLLDSAQQLPMQGHPTRSDAKKYLNSDYGKTEAWIVLSTRKVNGVEPYLLVGFNDTLDRAVFSQECKDGKFVRAESMLNKLLVKPGDVIVIRGGLPHAIGPGVTMVEVMEPSDWVIVPEIDCCGVQLTEAQRFMGIDPDTAIGMFDFTPMTEAQIRSKFSPRPVMLKQDARGSFKALIPPSECSLFSAYELAVNDEWILDNPDSFGICVVTEGEFDCEGTTVKRGGNFFLPYCTKTLRIKGHGKIVMIRPPEA